MNQAKTLKSKVDSATGSFLVADKYGVARYANDKVVQDTGYSLAEIVGKRPGQLWGGNMGQDFYMQMWDKIKIKKEPFFANIKNSTKSGKKYEKEMFFSPILDEYGSVQYFVELDPKDNIDNKKRFKQDFLDLFSKQEEAQAGLPKFILNWIAEDKKSLNTNKKTFSELLHDSFIEPIKEKFKSRRKDRILIKRAKKNPEEFQALYDKYKEDIYNYFSYRVSGDSIAYELTQDTFLKAFRYLDSFKITNASYKTYLMRIAHNLLVNHYRKLDKRSKVNIDDLPDSLFSHVEKYKDPWIRQKLNKAIEQELTNTQKKIIKMKYFDQLLVREIATILQKSENAVKLHLHRGRKRIKKFFE